jgi:regulator of protease activity HflC (stomatin/prohibitin superfamily)
VVEGEMSAVLGVLVGLAAAGLAGVGASIRVITQYERGIVFRFAGSSASRAARG